LSIHQGKQLTFIFFKNFPIDVQLSNSKIDKFNFSNHLFIVSIVWIIFESNNAFLTAVIFSKSTLLFISSILAFSFHFK